MNEPTLNTLTHRLNRLGRRKMADEMFEVDPNDRV